MSLDERHLRNHTRNTRRLNGNTMLYRLLQPRERADEKVEKRRRAAHGRRERTREDCGNRILYIQLRMPVRTEECTRRLS